jgi:hypothetical protein
MSMNCPHCNNEISPIDSGRCPEEANGNPPASSGVLPDSASEFLVCLVRPDDAGSFEDETEKVDVGSSVNSALGFIDRELEFVCQEGFHSFHYPVTGTLALHQNDEVVRIVWMASAKNKYIY